MSSPNYPNCTFLPGRGFFLEFCVFSYVTIFPLKAAMMCWTVNRGLSGFHRLHIKVIQIGLQRLNSLKSKMEFGGGVGLDDLQISLLSPTTLRNKTTNSKGKLVYAKAHIRFLNSAVTHLSVAQQGLNQQVLCGLWLNPWWTGSAEIDVHYFNLPIRLL